MVVWAGNLYGKENGPEIYAHLLFFLTLIGAYMNTYLFNPTNDKYYAMILMRMDARKYTLTDYGYTLLRTGLSFLPALLWISFSRGLPPVGLPAGAPAHTVRKTGGRRTVSAAV